MVSHPFWALAAALTFNAQAAAGQDGRLTLAEALDMARRNNGTVAAAYISYEQAQAQSRISYAQFLPTVTPSLTLAENEGAILTSPFRGSTSNRTETLAIDANWRLADNGQRKLDYRRSLINAEVAELDALQTLRSILLDVNVRFFEALRSQELLGVQMRQVERARVILEQTEFRASDDIGDAPKKDVRQAEADLLNAEVSQLAAENRVSNAEASLKAVIGRSGEDLPSLAAPSVDLEPLEFSLEEAFDEGLEDRADLQADRRNINGQEIGIRQAELDAGISYGLDLTFRRTFTGDPTENLGLALTASYPLFDGGRSRELVKVQRLSLAQLDARYVQRELDVLAEIESAYKEFETNRRRIAAAQAAYDAALINYQFAQEAQREGAANVIEVLTAQVSLATAEANLVEARYDLLISDARLRLVTGQPMMGEA